MGMAGLAARRAAAEALGRILDHGATVDQTAAEHPAWTGLAPRDRAFARLLLATTLRRLGEIDRILAERLAKGPPPGAARALAALRLGVAQLVYLGTPAHAAVATTVALLEGGPEQGLRGLVNAVLRRLAEHPPRRLDAVEAGRLDTPGWLYRGWVAAYGAETAAAIAAAHLVEAPLDLSVVGDADAWALRLGATLLPTGSLRLAVAGPVAALPGYGEGGWWVQDAAAALPARLLGPVAGLRVIDLCAAPGGKTAQLAAHGARVTAVDRSPARLARVGDNLRRLGLDAELVEADATAWRPAEPADAVLLDAPCTATGTIRRHPDILRRRRPEDTALMAALQDRLLDAAAAMVRPGGLVVYATCSLEPAEGPERVAAALARGLPLARAPLRPEEIPGLPEAATPAGDLRTLPSFWPAEGGMDGFFAARLRRSGQADT